MVKKLLCVSSELNGFTKGKVYAIIPNELNISFDKWFCSDNRGYVYSDDGGNVYNDNGEYVYITNSLINTYFKLIEEKSEVKEMNVEEMNINELYQLQSKLKEQIDKEVIQAIKEVNNTMKLLKNNLDVLFSTCQMFDIEVDDCIENLQNKLSAIMYDKKEKCIFN